MLNSSLFPTPITALSGLVPIYVIQLGGQLGGRVPLAATRSREGDPLSHNQPPYIPTYILFSPFAEGKFTQGHLQNICRKIFWGPFEQTPFRAAKRLEALEAQSHSRRPYRGPSGT